MILVHEKKLKNVEKEALSNASLLIFSMAKLHVSAVSAGDVAHVYFALFTFFLKHFN